MVLEEVVLEDVLVEIRDEVDVVEGVDDEDGVEKVVGTGHRKHDEFQPAISILRFRHSPTLDDEGIVEVVFTTGTAVVEVTLTGVDVVTARTCELVVAFGATTRLDDTRVDVGTAFVDELTARAIVEVRTGATAVVVVDIVWISPDVGAPARAYNFGMRNLLSAMLMVC